MCSSDGPQSASPPEISAEILPAAWRTDKDQTPPAPSARHGKTTPSSGQRSEMPSAVAPIMRPSHRRQTQQRPRQEAIEGTQRTVASGPPCGPTKANKLRDGG